MTVGTLDRTQTRYHASQDAAPTIDELEADLVECERAIAALRRRQAELIDLLDRLQVNLIDGSRTMADWVTSRLDVTHRTARDLVSIARTSRVASIKATPSIGSWPRWPFARPVQVRRLLPGRVDSIWSACTVPSALTGN